MNHLVHLSIQIASLQGNRFGLQTAQVADMKVRRFQQRRLCFLSSPRVGKVCAVVLQHLELSAKALFSLLVKVGGKQEPFQLECAYFSFFYDIHFDPSGRF